MSAGDIDHGMPTEEEKKEAELMKVLEGLLAECEEEVAQEQEVKSSRSRDLTEKSAPNPFAGGKAKVTAPMAGTTRARLPQLQVNPGKKKKD